MNTSNEKTDILYYDGNCPICAKEMQKLADCADSSITLADIHSLDDGSNRSNIPDSAELPDKETLLNRLHLRTADGRWLYGVDANVQAWQHTPYAKLWRILVWPLFKPFTLLGYEMWLRWRAWRKN